MTEAGVRKEVLMSAPVYNLVRRVMLASAKHQRVPGERISFIDALRWLLQAKGGRPLESLIVNPHRPRRFEPRVSKRRPKEYTLLKQPRDKLKQLLVAQRQAP